MIEEVTLKEVKAAWDEFNSLPKPWPGAPEFFYKNREVMWKAYAKARDHYLYQLKAITLYDLNDKWYPRVNGYQTKKMLEQ